MIALLCLGAAIMSPVRLWDTCHHYSQKFYSMHETAWPDRADWRQVPYGTTDYQFKGDPVLEGHNFWLFLHSSPHDAVFLYAKSDAEGTPSRHNELYRVFQTPNGYRNYGGGSGKCEIIKNSRDEIEVESASITYTRKGFETTVVTRYRIKADKPWLEVVPVSQAEEQGMHGESRFVLAPEAGVDGQDFVDDCLDHPGGYVCRVPAKAKMLLDLIMDDDTIWLLTARPVPKGTRLIWPGSRFYNGVAAGGWHAGWSRVGEGKCDRVWTAPFALFAGQPVYVGVLRIGYWHYQKVDRPVQAGEQVTVRFRVAYSRKIRGSPFSPGGPWRPSYPGKWRLVLRIDDAYHTLPITATPQQTTTDTLTFPAPASGKLRYLIFYLYDRTEETPSSVWTPTDIYRGCMGER